MKTFIAKDGPSDAADSSLEQMEVGMQPFHHLIDGDSSQGSEFLDDGIRMHEQPLATGPANERE